MLDTMKPTVSGACPYPGTGKSRIRGIAGSIMGDGVAVGPPLCAHAEVLNPARTSKKTANAPIK